MSKVARKWLSTILAKRMSGIGTASYSRPPTAETERRSFLKIGQLESSGAEGVSCLTCELPTRRLRQQRRETSTRAWSVRAGIRHWTGSNQRWCANQFRPLAISYMNCVSIGRVSQKHPRITVEVSAQFFRKFSRSTADVKNS